MGPRESSGPEERVLELELELELKVGIGSPLLSSTSSCRQWNMLRASPWARMSARESRSAAFQDWMAAKRGRGRGREPCSRAR